jgi:hypothetical protein
LANTIQRNTDGRYGCGHPEFGVSRTPNAAQTGPLGKVLVWLEYGTGITSYGIARSYVRYRTCTFRDVMFIFKSCNSHPGTGSLRRLSREATHRCSLSMKSLQLSYYSHWITVGTILVPVYLYHARYRTSTYIHIGTSHPSTGLQVVRGTVHSDADRNSPTLTRESNDDQDLYRYYRFAKLCTNPATQPLPHRSRERKEIYRTRLAAVDFHRRMLYRKK